MARRRRSTYDRLAEDLLAAVVRLLWRRGGRVAIAITLVAWEPLDPGNNLLLITAGVLHFSFVTPVWCGAVTREGRLCRNNAHGLLLGCHLREHRWQKLTLAIAPGRGASSSSGCATHHLGTFGA